MYFALSVVGLLALYLWLRASLIRPDGNFVATDERVEEELLRRAIKTYKFPESNLLIDLGVSVRERCHRLTEEQLATLEARIRSIETRICLSGTTGEISAVNIVPNGLLLSFELPANSDEKAVLTTLQNLLWIDGAIVHAPIESNWIEIFYPTNSPHDITIGADGETCAFSNLELDCLLAASPITTTNVLPIILGVDRELMPVVRDLAELRNVVAVGATGSGKTTLAEQVILSLLWCRSPDDLVLIVVADDEVSYSAYEDLPHLPFAIITSAGEYTAVVAYLAEEVQRRTKLFVDAACRNISSYNEKLISGASEISPRLKLPHVCAVFDCSTFDNNINDHDEVTSKTLGFIVENGYKFGIHIVFCAHSECLTINALSEDHCTYAMLDNVGVELPTWFPDYDVAHGDQADGNCLLFSNPPFPEVIRLARPSDGLSRKLANHWAGQGRPRANSPGPFEANSEDANYLRARQFVLEGKRTSTSWLQRQMGVTYAIAAAWIERMEQEGLVTPPNHQGKREFCVNESNHSQS